MTPLLLFTQTPFVMFCNYGNCKIIWLYMVYCLILHINHKQNVYKTLCDFIMPILSFNKQQNLLNFHLKVLKVSENQKVSHMPSKILSLPYSFIIPSTPSTFNVYLCACALYRCEIVWGAEWDFMIFKKKLNIHESVTYHKLSDSNVVFIL